MSDQGDHWQVINSESTPAASKVHSWLAAASRCFSVWQPREQLHAQREVEERKHKKL